MKSLFLLDTEVTFLNHGSFGACPRPVFEFYQDWQRRLESQPIELLGRQFHCLLAGVRSRLADYLHADESGLLLVPNTTTAINMVARSLRLEPGDEILTTDREYGAMDYTWEFVCSKTMASYVKYHVDTCQQTHQEFVEDFWNCVTPRTKVIFLSHITSATATTFPVARICRRAREKGIVTIIDGAHAPGQIPLNLTEIDADFYAGNCHKWMCAPKGTAFLSVHRGVQKRLDPTVVSWGWTPESSFVERHAWQGTRDIASFLSIPVAIDFQAEHEWDAVRQRCHELARFTRRTLADHLGVDPLVPDHADWFTQMIATPIPRNRCGEWSQDELQRRLREEHRIEIPITKWTEVDGREHYAVRASFQGYNTRSDADALIAAIAEIFPA